MGRQGVDWWCQTEAKWFSRVMTQGQAGPRPALGGVFQASTRVGRWGAGHGAEGGCGPPSLSGSGMVGELRSIWEVSKEGHLVASWAPAEWLPQFCLGSPRWHRPSDVQGPHWQGSPRVLYQPAAGCPGVLPAPYQHGRGEGREAGAIFTLLLPTCTLAHSFFSLLTCYSSVSPNPAPPQ